jgi:hypothetical protein
MRRSVAGLVAGLMVLAGCTNPGTDDTDGRARYIKTYPAGGWTHTESTCPTLGGTGAKALGFKGVDGKPGPLHSKLIVTTINCTWGEKRYSQNGPWLEVNLSLCKSQEVVDAIWGGMDYDASSVPGFADEANLLDIGSIFKVHVRSRNAVLAVTLSWPDDDTTPTGSRREYALNLANDVLDDLRE